MTDNPSIVSDKDSAFYGTRYFAAIPIIVMLAPVIALTFTGVLSTEVLVATGIIGLVAGSLLNRRKKEYWDVVTTALTDPLGLTVFSLFLLVGIYGTLLTESQLSEGIVWLSNQLALGPGLFLLFMYVICSILGTAMGTSLGIVVIMTPILYPAAIGVGVDPMLAAGAILSGAATGDHLAPVSDTTIISSMTQRYRNKSGCAEIGGVVRARMQYVIPAFALSCVLYLLIGSMIYNDPVASLSSGADADGGQGLLMLIPMAVVVTVAIMQRTIFEALTYGIIIGIVVALLGGLITAADLFSIEGGSAQGILIEGATQNIATITMIILLMGVYGVLKEYGLLDQLVAKLDNLVGNSPRSTELTMFGFTWLLSFALIGLVGRLTVIAGPILDALGSSQNLHPYRRANILDAVVNSWSFIVPWHVWPILMIIQIQPLHKANELIPVPAATDFLLSTYYPVIIWLVLLGSIITGFGRRFEGANGEQVITQGSS